ncbi:MAG: Ditrans,polycis-undecaprenyl-diphosphate synthase ((2E,6E)-farnesyl-diphosphate specific), partial [Candidatus Anoxychlamydiales bacterium]|nr:Ditrans,polycis-undecaprenyl-diphosphate synthase ((2E,6E)-farnesyl-diphosphate specific) [Candidatus Anoxychlamydiales bacterium]
MMLNVKKNNTKQNIDLDKFEIPQHIAIIMDGNRRWA